MIGNGLVFRGGTISSGRKKSRGTNSGDGGNTRDEGKMGGGVIGAYGSGIGDSLLVALYACMTFIYGSSWKGEMASEVKRYVVKSFEGSGEVFPDNDLRYYEALNGEFVWFVYGSTIKAMNWSSWRVLTSVDNDANLGTDEGISNLADKGTNNVSSSNTPIGEKIDKIERQICKGKLRFMNDDGNPLVPTGIVESDSEVEVVFDETVNLRISTSGKDGSDKGYGNNSLLEQ
ncbi:hypothetical protein Tco_1191844 [Tanacetum coccineum]